MKMAFPAKAKITALVCSGRRRPKANQGARFSCGPGELRGDDDADEETDESPDDGRPEELPDDVIVVAELVQRCGAGAAG